MLYMIDFLFCAQKFESCFFINPPKLKCNVEFINLDFENSFHVVDFVFFNIYSLMQTSVTIFSVLTGSCGGLRREFVLADFHYRVHMEKVVEKGQGQRKGQKKGKREQQKQF